MYIIAQSWKESKKVSWEFTLRGPREILKSEYKNRELKIIDFAIRKFVEEIESLSYNIADDPDIVLIKKM